MNKVIAKARAPQTPSLTLPPGPQALTFARNALALRGDPLVFLSDLIRRYGDICHLPLGIWQAILINHPEYIERVLLKQHQSYDKQAPIFTLANRIFAGNGLVTVVGGKPWQRQRRLIQPTFHKQRLAGFASIMTGETLVMLQRWAEVEKAGQTLDVSQEMLELSLTILARSLFSTDLGGEKSGLIREAFGVISKFLIDFVRLPFPPLGIAISWNRRYREVLQSLDRFIYDLIRERRGSGELGDDLFGMLLDARDEETGEGMSDLQLRDEVVTFLFAGSESSGAGMGWAWYLLARHPEVEATLHEELERVLAGRLPGVDDLSQLVYTRMIIDEILRLYPPAWLLMRRAAQDDEIDGFRIPQHSIVLWSSYLLHRHPEFWEEPGEFRPERFAPEKARQIPRGAYVPFGVGPRICIGNNFGLMEMTLVIATVAQSFRPRLSSSQVVKPEQLAVLRPQPIPVHLQARR